MNDTTLTIFSTPPAGPRHAHPDTAHPDTAQPVGGYGPPPGYQSLAVPPRDPAAPLEAEDWGGPGRGSRFVRGGELSAVEAALPQLRQSAAIALARLNWDHAATAWGRRSRDPISPHALLLFYADPDPDPDPDLGGMRLRMGCRIFLGADEPRLPVLLHHMCQVTAEHVAAGHDPRTHVVNWVDPMSARATYLGIAVSTLDTPTTSWEQVRRTAYSDMDVPGYGYLALHTDTRMSLDRRPVRDLGETTIVSNHPVGYTSAHLGRFWRYDPYLADPTYTDGDTGRIWTWLGHLHHTLSPKDPHHA